MRFIVASSLRWRYLVVAAAAALIVFGSQTLAGQKVDVFPEFAPITVELQTECLGLSPSEVGQLVTVPLENGLQGVPGVNRIRSESVPQLSAIFLFFKNGTDILQARQLVQERLAQAAPTLPTWCTPPALYPIVSATSRRDPDRAVVQEPRPARPLARRPVHDPPAIARRARRGQRRHLGRAAQGGAGTGAIRPAAPIQRPAQRAARHDGQRGRRRRPEVHLRSEDRHRRAGSRHRISGSASATCR